MENKDKPAFPEPYINHPNLSLSTMPGLTKREYFAAMAMQKMCDFGSWDIRQEVVKRSIDFADELLKQLEDGKH